MSDRGLNPLFFITFGFVAALAAILAFALAPGTVTGVLSGILMVVAGIAVMSSISSLLH